MSTSTVTLSLILEKISSKDKDFRYMATSDLANALALPSFQFDNANQEEQVVAAVLNQLEDQSSDISSLATKCLGLLCNKVSPDRLRSLAGRLTDAMLSSKKDQQRDVASLGLKNVIAEVVPSKARTLAEAAVPRLQEGLRADAPDAAANSLEALVELAARHGGSLPDPDVLRAALMPELDATRAGTRKKAIQCLALLAAHLPAASLDSLAGDLLSRLAAAQGKKDAARTYIQALGALSKSVGFKLGGRMGEAVPAVEARLRAAGDSEDEETMELALAALESFVQRCPGDCKPYAEALTTDALKYLKFDPNYAASDGEDEEMGGEDDEEYEDEEAYSDEDDGSWKVRRGAAKLAAALVAAHPEALGAAYGALAPALVARFKEREEAVRPDVYGAYGALLRAMGGAARRGDAGAKAALAADVPGVMRALARQLRTRSSKTRSLALKALGEVVTAAPAEAVAAAGEVLPGVVAALEDTFSGASSLKMDALAFLNAALGATPPAAFQPHAAAVTPAVVAAAGDRYYAVSADALRACEALVHVLRPECPAAVPADLASLVAPLFGAAAGRLAAQDQGLEVKEAAISAAATAVAKLGDALEGDSAQVGSLAEEFAAMPKSKGRASKRAKTAKGATEMPAPANAPLPGKIAEVMTTLLERLRNESTRLAAVRAFATVARTPLQLDLTPVLPAALAELTSFLRKASRQLRLAALGALGALVARDGPRADPAALEATVAEAAALVGDADLAVAAAALRLVEGVVREQTLAADAACDKVLGPAVGLVGSPLLQGGVLDALQSLLAALAASGARAASFDRLIALLTEAGTAAGAAAGAPAAAARCVAALCRSAGQDKVVATAGSLLASLETPKTDAASRRFALLCLGELGRGSDLTAFPALPELLTTALGAEEIAEAASLALGGVASGDLGAYLPLVLQQLAAAAGDPKLQYQLLRALNEAITTAARTAGGSPPLAPAQVAEALQLLLSGAAVQRDEECGAVVSECLGHLALLAPADVLPALSGQLATPAPEARAVAVSALRHAAVEREHPVDAPLADLLPQALALAGDPSVGVRRAATLLLSAAAHNKPSLVAPSLPVALPLVLAQTKPDPSLMRTVDLGPFKHHVDDGLEARKAAFECLGVLMATCYEALDPGALLEALLEGLKDAYDVRMAAHGLLASLAGAAPGAIAAALDRLAEPLAATLTARVKSDAVKQEVDRNEDMLRSCLRAVNALDRLPGAGGMATWKAFMEGTVQVGAMRERYAAIVADRKQAEGSRGWAGGSAGAGAEAMDLS